jgi:Mn-containing catalase
MAKKLKTLRISERGQEKLSWLARRYGNETTVWEIALDQLYNNEKEKVMLTSELTDEAREEWMAKNDYNWYLVDYDDGTTELVHATGLSNILQCGHGPAEYDIIRMEQCGA